MQWAGLIKRAPDRINLVALKTCCSAGSLVKKQQRHCQVIHDRIEYSDFEALEPLHRIRPLKGEL